MKKSSVVAVLFSSVTLFCSVLLGPNASASPINLDFSDGLNGWGADIVYFDGVIDRNSSSSQVCGYYSLPVCPDSRWD
ncbi:hypothetical protein [Alteromonas sp. KUL49]|uniref:hypothetical protein n=1 Tax=Alteromonas sp. KUL49 TaxID=2480798 RepID=UPI00102F05E1|nr:hypothetical protein [Alteromonas sp. KUL49]TAP34486.1 hypothetical protein EYS00_19255 [Alteromonas sp. KUL49]GEA13535.1 hypothetical protein KUL49_39100 [Alteromonas sp. KUL49]